MWPQLGGHPVVRPHPKPLGQDHEPAGTEPDGVADARGAAAGTQRTGGAIAPPPRLPALYVENHAGERPGEGIGSPHQRWLLLRSFTFWQIHLLELSQSPTHTLLT